jgi:hypothetical protein
MPVIQESNLSFENVEQRNYSLSLLEMWVTNVGYIIGAGLNAEAEILLRHLVELLKQIPVETDITRVTGELELKLLTYMVSLDLLDLALSVANSNTVPGDQAAQIAFIVKYMVAKGKTKEAYPLFIKAMLLSKYRYDTAMGVLGVLGELLPKLVGEENVSPIFYAVKETKEMPVFDLPVETTDVFLEKLIQEF